MSFKPSTAIKRLQRQRATVMQGAIAEFVGGNDIWGLVKWGVDEKMPFWGDEVVEAVANQ